ncbi:RNA polymerase sigma factor [Actinoplanes sp. DH11]|uniref:RNA polymerase sigma factor n=1 Tax=Actinoplanes sp. DH11 TaxID=2857011 RepID=UPI001E3DBF25|nr:sigma-70 family RNA polymerase sigma factor [Actinoplanes sp. DH11]
MSSDDELAERLRDGDERALRTAYDRYGAAVFHLAQRLLPGDATGAEDVTRSTFVAAWNGRDAFDPARATMLGWLLGIARRKAVDRLRQADPASTAVRPSPESPSRDTPATLTPDTPASRSPGTPASRDTPELAADRLIVADELARLPADQRRTLELAFFDGLTQQQLVAVTGLPPDVVRSHIRTGMAHLRRRWEVDGAASGSRSAGPSRAL